MTFPIFLLILMWVTNYLIGQKEKPSEEIQEELDKRNKKLRREVSQNLGRTRGRGSRLEDFLQDLVFPKEEGRPKDPKLRKEDRIEAETPPKKTGGAEAWVRPREVEKEAQFNQDLVESSPEFLSREDLVRGFIYKEVLSEPKARTRRYRNSLK